MSGRTESDHAAETIVEKASGAVGIRQLVKMVGLQSVKAGTDYEADVLKQEAADIRCNMYGECGEPMSEKGSDEVDDAMRDLLAAGPVTIHQGSNNESSAETKRSVAGKIASYGLAALGLGAAVSLPILAWNLTRPAETQSETQLGARFVPVPQK